MKCKHCGFDSMEESIKMVGAPCGFNGCTVFICCIEAWDEHVKTYHAGEVDRVLEEFKVQSSEGSANV